MAPAFAKEDVVDVVIHRKSTGAVCVSLGIVPLKVNAGKFFAFPVFAHFIVLVEDSKEVVSMLPADIFHCQSIRHV